MYEEGEEPDYRFTFANERTFLAWIRTALALIAAGVAVDAFDLEMATWAQVVIAGLLVLLGGFCAAVAWSRWARSERAIRHGQPLPAAWVTAVVAACTLAVGAIVFVAAV